MAAIIIPATMPPAAPISIARFLISVLLYLYWGAGAAGVDSRNS
jgi:hypothetical protein